MVTYITTDRALLIRRLRERRLRLGLALDYVAKACYISIQDLESYECGKKAIPQDVLLKLAALYQISPDYFLGGVPVD